MDTFKTWLHANDDPLSFVGLDTIAAELIECCWAEGEPKGTAGDISSGLQHSFPRERDDLKQAWRLYGAWCKAEIPTRAFPLSAAAVKTPAGAAFAMWLPVFGTFLLVGFQRALGTRGVVKL